MAAWLSSSLTFIGTGSLVVVLKKLASTSSCLACDSDLTVVANLWLGVVSNMFVVRSKGTVCSCGKIL